MSRFTDGLRVIPRTAWVIAVAFYILMSNLAITVFIPSDKEIREWPVVGKVAVAYGAFLVLPLAVLLIGYVFGDAKRRGMRYVMWTWLAILVPNGIGIILYFILRDPLPQPCPNCANLVNSKFVFCPHCGAAMKPACPNCGRAIERGWSNCPECGTKLPALTTSPRTV